MTVFYREGEESRRTTYAYTYDANGNRLSSEYGDPVTRRTVWTYDDNNNRLSEESEDEEGTVTSRRVWTWSCR